MKIRITNTDASSITFEMSGESFVLDKDTVQIFTDPDTRKDNLTLTGFGTEGLKKFDFLLADVVLPASPASKSALIATVQGYCSGGPEMQVFTPLTGVTIAPTASKNRRLSCIVKPAGTIAALTITMPAMFDGQIFSLTTSQIVSALTVTPNGTSTIQGNPTVTTTTFTRSWIYNAAQDTLFMI